jgi:hypothetical protein
MKPFVPTASLDRTRPRIVSAAIFGVFMSRSLSMAVDLFRPIHLAVRGVLYSDIGLSRD